MSQMCLLQVNQDLQSSFALMDEQAPLTGRVAASLRQRTHVPAIDNALPPPVLVRSELCFVLWPVLVISALLCQLPASKAGHGLKPALLRHG